MIARKPLPEKVESDSSFAPSVCLPPPHEHVWSMPQFQLAEEGPENATVPGVSASGMATSNVNMENHRRVGASSNPSFDRGDNIWEDNVWATEDANPGARSGTKTTDVLGSAQQPSNHGTPGADGHNRGVGEIPAVHTPGDSAETNPFKRHLTGAGLGAPSNMSAQDVSRVQSSPAAASLPLSAAMSDLKLNDSSKNPWQLALDKVDASIPNDPVRTEDISLDASGRQGTLTLPKPSPPSSRSPALLSFSSEDESAGWDEEPRGKNGPLVSKSQAGEDEDLSEESNAWDDLGKVDKGKGPEQPGQASSPEMARDTEDWNLVDVEPQHSLEEGKRSPSLPAQRPRPPRRVSRSETYQIKNISWYDAGEKEIRTSPILVQNANGPCPLLALVNALTLTTPANTSTALVDILRSREQVSLSLLLDAVFDELMSSRRSPEDKALPDVTELYSFLQGLHTGMNVNPRFIPTSDALKVLKRTSLTHLHPIERDDHIPGTFEQTTEMALYSTFSIPLIHGWLPRPDEPAYDAFSRLAPSYEDAQNLLFREEEFEDMLSDPAHQGLTEEEQQDYRDILNIKAFLMSSATQLTHWGLEVISKAMEPGSVAILFRNDHFSTLYRHPVSLQILGLVTDAGYANHADVVWESIVDVSGENAEFLTGGFRVIGGATQLDGKDGTPTPGGSDQVSSSPGGLAGDSSQEKPGRTTAQGSGSQDPGNQSESGVSLSAHEQEDRDLALALQLQEEEEARHRSEQVRRRRERESELSEQFIEQQARTGAPADRGGRGEQGGARGGRGGAIAPVLNNNGAARGRNVSNTAGNTASRMRNGVRSLLPSRHDNNTRPAAGAAPAPAPAHASAPAPAPAASAQDDEDDAPPSYEHAAKMPSYLPPAGHPSHPASSPANSRRASASTASPSGTRPPGAQMNGAGRNPSTHNGAPGRMRQGVSPAAAVAGNGGGGRDRDCVVM